MLSVFEFVFALAFVFALVVVSLQPWAMLSKFVLAKSETASLLVFALALALVFV